MDETMKILFASTAQELLREGGHSQTIINAIQQQGISYNDALEALETGNKFLRDDLLRENYFQVGAPGKKMSKLLCSDNSCPCPGTETLHPGKNGYLYIDKIVINNRKNAITSWDLEKAAKTEIANSTVPVLVCKIGADGRNVNLEIARKDAEVWFEKGIAPLRPTPSTDSNDKAKEIKTASNATKNNHYPISNILFIWLCPSSPPTMNTMIGIATKVCPEYSEIDNPVGKVALSWDNESSNSWLNKNDIKKMAVETFGIKIVDETQFTLEVKQVSSQELGDYNGEGIYLVVKQKKAEKPKIESPKTEQPKGGNCFIATATYGDSDHPNVRLFRKFRDEHLLTSVMGRLLVGAYYLVSPKIALAVKGNGILKRIALRLLNRIAKGIKD